MTGLCALLPMETACRVPSCREASRGWLQPRDFLACREAACREGSLVGGRALWECLSRVGVTVTCDCACDCHCHCHCESDCECYNGPGRRTGKPSLCADCVSAGMAISGLWLSMPGGCRGSGLCGGYFTAQVVGELPVLLRLLASANGRACPVPTISWRRSRALPKTAPSSIHERLPTVSVPGPTTEWPEYRWRKLGGKVRSRPGGPCHSLAAALARLSLPPPLLQPTRC